MYFVVQDSKNIEGGVRGRASVCVHTVEETVQGRVGLGERLGRAW